MKFTAERALVTAFIVVAAVVLAQQFADHKAVMIAVAAVAAVAVLLISVAPGGRTVGDRIRRRRNLRHPLRVQNLLYRTGQHGIVWDGQAASMFVAFSPTPFQLSITDTADPVLPPPVPMDLLRDYMEQQDIEVPVLTVMQVGYRRFRRSAYTDAYESKVGDQVMATSLGTIIEVPVNLATSMYDVAIRDLTNSTPDAIGTTTNLAATRLSRALSVAGYESRVLSPGDIRWFQASVQGWMNSGLREERWRHLDGDTPTVVCHPAEWTGRAALKWWQVPADRMSSAFQIRPRDQYGREQISGALAFAYPSASEFPDKSYYLRRAGGEQGDAVTAMLPLARTVDDSASRTTALVADDRYPIDIPGTGLGMYLGPCPSGGRAFMNTQTGGETMYVHASADLLAIMIARASAVGATVGIHLDGPGWEELAAKVDPDMIMIKPSQRCSIEIYRDKPPSRVGAATSVWAWTPRALPAAAGYSMALRNDGSSIVDLVTPAASIEFVFEPSDAERSFLPTGQ